MVVCTLQIPASPARLPPPILAPLPPPRTHPHTQDLRGALDEVSSSLQVRFEFKPSRALEVQGRRVILHLDRDAVPESAVPPGMSREDLLSRTYGVTTVRLGGRCEE